MTTAEVFSGPGPFCAGCQLCCKHMPGAMSPHNLLPDWQEQVLAMLTSGRWTLDWWEGDVLPGGELSRVLYLRPTVKGHEGQLEHAGWGGTCTFLGDTGCQLDRDAMPTECRALTPMQVPDGDCVQNYGKRQVVIDWRPHQNLLLEVLRIAEQDRDD